MAGAAPGANTSYGSARKLIAAKAKEYSIVSSYKLGYRNREDITNLPAGVLIVGSQNALHNISDRIQIRQGYSVDGQVSTNNSPILSSFDFKTRFNEEVHLRAGLNDTGTDGKLQYRYVDGSGTVTWNDLLTNLTSVNFNFTTFWDSSETLRECLFVNGASQIQKWNGAIATLASADNTAGHIAALNATPTAGGTGYTVGDILTITTGGTGGTAKVLTLGGSGAVASVSLVTVGSGYTTGTGNATSGGTGTGATLNITTVSTGSIVVNGTSTIGQLGFYVNSNLSLSINGNTYTYTSTFGNTFLGINTDPSGEAVNSLIVQSVVTTLNSAMTNSDTTFPTFQNGLISVLNNQIYLASLTSSVVYISKVGSYTDYSYSTPRQTGEGDIETLDENVVALIPQQNFMYVSAGTDLWYNISFQIQTSTVGVTYEQVNVVPLKTGQQQGALSQAFVSHMKNFMIVGTNETTIDMFGTTENYFENPQQTNISDPIKIDIDSYDFTDGSIFYYRYHIFVCVPKEGLVLMYNLATKTWETPQTLPISRFYIVNGQLYGHSYESSESYQMFVGYADRVYPGFLGHPINFIANFSYENYGTRFSLKQANALYVEGYINSNTALNITLTYEIDGCATMKNFTINGSDTQVVCIRPTEGSLGKESLGKVKLGGSGTSSLTGLPPKFRAIPTFTNTDFYECSLSFSILGVNQRMELLAFGLNASESTQEAVAIKK